MPQIQSRAAHYLEKAEECLRISKSQSDPRRAGDYRYLMELYLALVERDRRG